MFEPYRDPTAPIWIIDNRDSFVFNLAHRIHEVGSASFVVRSDEVTVADVVDAAPSAIILSPGPGHPDDAGISVALIQALATTTPMLGVCLGHQAIASAFGGTVGRNNRPMHGKVSRIEHDGHRLFEGVQPTFEAARYHSLTVLDCPSELEVIARLDDGEVMAIAHREFPVFGVQFHPESILSEVGYTILRNFLGCWS